MDEIETFDQQRDRVKEEQSGSSYDEVKEQMAQRSKFLVELDNLKPQEHRWVDRGTVMVCEGGNHASHRAYKRRR